MDKGKKDDLKTAEGQSTERSTGILRSNSVPRSRSRATSPLSAQQVIISLQFSITSTQIGRRK